VDAKEWEGREFWYGDSVRFPDRKGSEKTKTFYVLGFSPEMSRKDEDVYDYSDAMHDASWFGWFSPQEETVELVARGNFWKHGHNEPLTFVDLREEIRFHCEILEAYEEIRHPKTMLYSWGKDEALAAIKAHKAHGMKFMPNFFGGPPYLSLYRLHDAALGERVRKATLEGFNMVEEEDA
jgi:hypothetical protein